MSSSHANKNPALATAAAPAPASMPAQPPVVAFGECPYTVDDVPNETWTTEHYLMWLLLQQHDQYDQMTQASIRALKETAAELLGTTTTTTIIASATTTTATTTNSTAATPSVERHNNNNNNNGKYPTDERNDYDEDEDDANNNHNKNHVLASSTNQKEVQAKNNNNNNISTAAPPAKPALRKAAAKSKAAVPPSTTKKQLAAKKPTAVTASTATAAAAATAFTPELHATVLECVSDPSINGQVFTLHPKPRAPCWVGRSRNKQIRERGISLCTDSEVSTTHGKFEVRMNNNNTDKPTFWFTDTGSTNGSYIWKHATLQLEHDDRFTLQPNEPFELLEGTELIVGTTKLRMHLVTSSVAVSSSSS